jgi:tetratricopeptide (TPR) repeat protein
MEERLKKMMEAMKKLHQDRKLFWAQTDAKAYSMADLLERFLECTDSIFPEEIDDVRLGIFAEDCYDHLGWTGTCQAYEHILAEDLGSASSIYHSWTFFGTALMKDAEELSFEERVHVAADVEAVYERAAVDLEYYWENSLGYFYYDHPLKVEQPEFYLLKSKEWFERAIASDEFNECDHHDVQVFGHVFFELGDLESALHWYQKFAAMEDRCVNGCFLDPTLTRKRLAACEQKLIDSKRQ